MPAPTDFSIASHLHPFQIPPADYAKSNGIPIAHLVASAVVIHQGRVLLGQRAAHSFQALLWELPGGRCETKDQTVIASAARELWEETGLVATKVVDLVSEYQWLDQGEVWKKVTFLMQVETGPGRDEMPEVKLDPKEQAGSIWATKAEVIADRCGEVALRWTSDDQKRTVLDAFNVLEGCS